jgi:hypothetical protein
VTLAENVTYLNGKDIIAGNGFPVINGAEVYSLDNAAGAQVDPPSGTVPSGGLASGNSATRTATNGTAFTSRAAANATPGTYEGTPADTGRLVITEVSDAAAFQHEFVELFYDAFTPAADPLKDTWMIK